ncbi:type IV secretion system protein [Alcaligenes sp. CHO6]|uniref:type IV secretion system protein n=1 Tax=Alcaligenes sp. CHO6 TaxID=3123298 RepID=UPI003014CB67
MTRIRARVVSVLLATCLTTPLVQAAGGIPTLDVNSIPQLNALLDQLETARAQLNQTRAQLDALTKSSGFGYVLNNPSVQQAIRASLPSDAAALIDRLDGQNTALSGAVHNITADVNSSVDFSRDPEALREKGVRLAATQRAMSEQAYNAMTKRLETIDGLQAQINQTTNPKEIAELQARIAVEQANIQADQTRVELAKQQFAAERELLRKRADVIYGGWLGKSQAASE